MKTLFISLCLVGALVSCSDSSESESSSKKEKGNQEIEVDSNAILDSIATVDSIAMVDSVQMADSLTRAERLLNEDEIALIGKYLAKESVDDLIRLNKLGNEINEDGGFIEFHNEYVNNIDPLKLKNPYSSSPEYDIIDRASKDFETLGRKLHGIEITCVAECTELDFTIRFSVWDSLAKITADPIDDEYVAIHISAEGDYGHGKDYGFKNWFMAMCDYGGSTLIGDDIALKFLIAYDQYKSKNSGFDFKWLDNLRKDALHMLHSYRSHMRTGEKVSAELKKVLEQVTLNDEEKAAINKRLEELSDPESNDLDLDCENQNCPYC